MLEKAAAAYRDALPSSREEAPLEWAATQNNLGILFSELGERETGTDVFWRRSRRLDKAAQGIPRDSCRSIGRCCRTISARADAAWRTPDSSDSARAQSPPTAAHSRIHAGQGARPMVDDPEQSEFCLVALAEREQGSDAIRKASGAFEAALSSGPANARRSNGRMTEMMLGNALQMLGVREHVPKRRWRSRPPPTRPPCANSRASACRSTGPCCRIIWQRAVVAWRDDQATPARWRRSARSKRARQAHAGAGAAGLGGDQERISAPSTARSASRTATRRALRKAIALLRGRADRSARASARRTMGGHARHLGNAWMLLSYRDGGEEALLQAVAAYEASLLDPKREQVPEIGRTMQWNIGLPLLARR